MLKEQKRKSAALDRELDRLIAAEQARIAREEAERARREREKKKTKQKALQAPKPLIPDARPKT